MELKNNKILIVAIITVLIVLIAFNFDKVVDEPDDYSTNPQKYGIYCENMWIYSYEDYYEEDRDDIVSELTVSAIEGGCYNFRTIEDNTTDGFNRIILWGDCYISPTAEGCIVYQQELLDIIDTEPPKNTIEVRLDELNNQTMSDLNLLIDYYNNEECCYFVYKEGETSPIVRCRC